MHDVLIWILLTLFGYFIYYVCESISHFKLELDDLKFQIEDLKNKLSDKLDNHHNIKSDIEIQNQIKTFKEVYGVKD